MNKSFKQKKRPNIIVSNLVQSTLAYLRTFCSQKKCVKTLEIVKI